jgi:polygalacturonase
VNTLPVEAWAVNLSAYELSIPVGVTYSYNAGSYHPGSYYSNTAGTAGAYNYKRLTANAGPYEPNPFNPTAAGAHVVTKSSLVATLTPANATNKAVTWESSDEAIVKVSAGSNTPYDCPTAVITGVAPGSAQIIAKNGNRQAVCTVTVTDGTVKATSVTLNKPSAMTLYADATVTDLKATVLPASATDNVVVFKSSNPDVVYIDKYDGVIWAHEPGTATITATARGGDSVVATVDVTVEAGNKFVRNLMTPPESITESSVLLLWNRDAYNNITNLAECRIYQDGAYVGNSTRDLSARDLTSGGLKTEMVGQRQVTHWTSPLSHAVAPEYAIRMGSQVTDLEPGTEYKFRVDACDKDGVVLGSDTITVKTKAAPTAIIDVTKPPYNATGNGVNTDTYAIQRAVNDCPPGGKVILPEGNVFLSGAIFLKSDMTFTVDGILLGSTNPKDYPRMNTRWEGWRKVGTGTIEDSATIPNSQSHASIVTIGTYDEGVNTKTGPFNVKNVVLNGKGQINANGYTLGYHQGPNSKTPKVRTSYVLYNKERSGDGLDFRVRSRMLTVQSSQNIYVSNVTISYSASWGIHNIFSDRVTYDSVDVILRGYGRSGTADQNCILNGDGINPDSTSNLNIFDCYFNTGDDCITLKSGRNGQGWLINKPTKFIRVTDSCTVGSKGGWAIGSEQAGGANNTLLQNFYAEDINLETIWVKYRWARGGLMEYLDFRDTSMNWIRGTAVYINPGYSSGSQQPSTEAPVCRKLFFENITSESVTNRTCTGWSFSGVASGSESVFLGSGSNQTLYYPVLPVQNVVIKNSGLATGSNNNTTSFSMAYVRGLTATNLNYFTTTQPTTYATTNTDIIINGRVYNPTTP